MGKTLVTGGTGFLGSHLVRALAVRGDELRLLLRESSRTDHLAAVSYEAAIGDVTDRDAVRAAMEGVDRVFHVAGRTSLRPADAQRVRAVNVVGTSTVLAEAERAGVSRMVHTSSVAAFGPTVGSEPGDESQPYSGGGLGIPYVEAKHEAEEAAGRRAAEGFPVVIVNPSFVLGPDDPYGTSMMLVRRFLRRQIPAYVNGGLNVVDVRDVAAGHLLADERGEIGRRYILGARNFTLKRLFADLSRISGAPPPPVRVPGIVASGSVALAERIGLPLPISEAEVRSARLRWTYRNDRAVRELGFRPRAHEETLEDAVRWQASELGHAAEGNPLQDGVMRTIGSVARFGERVVGR